MSETPHPDTPENIDWHSFLPAVITQLRETAAQALGHEYELEAEDVVMDVVSRFLSYKRHLPAFQSEESALGYLIKMARNMAIEHLRGLKKRDDDLDPLDELLEDTQAHRSIEKKIYDNELKEALKIGLAPLAGRERLLFELYLSGCSRDEISERLGEDARVTRHDLATVLAKVRYHLKKAASRRPGE